MFHFNIKFIFSLEKDVPQKIDERERDVWVCVRERDQKGWTLYAKTLFLENARKSGKKMLKSSRMYSVTASIDASLENLKDQMGDRLSWLKPIYVFARN